MARPLLRPGLLAGTRVVVASVPEGAEGAAERAQVSPAGVAEGFGRAVWAIADGLGAEVAALAVDPFGDQPAPLEPAADQLVWDGASAFAAAGESSVEAVRAALDGAWLAIRACAPEPTTRIVLIAPRPGDAHAAAARAGLENLARTLSIEWARFGVRTVAIHPGATTAAQAVAELCAFLASPAGEYHSGSLIELDGA